MNFLCFFLNLSLDSRKCTTVFYPVLHYNDIPAGKCPVQVAKPTIQHELVSYNLQILRRLAHIKHDDSPHLRITGIFRRN